MELAAEDRRARGLHPGERVDRAADPRPRRSSRACPAVDLLGPLISALASHCKLAPQLRAGPPARLLRRLLPPHRGGRVRGAPRRRREPAHAVPGRPGARRASRAPRRRRSRCTWRSAATRPATCRSCPGIDPPRELLELDPRKVFGLVGDAAHAARRSAARASARCGASPYLDYADPERGRARSSQRARRLFRERRAGAWSTSPAARSRRTPRASSSSTGAWRAQLERDGPLRPRPSRSSRLPCDRLALSFWSADRLALLVGEQRHRHLRPQDRVEGRHHRDRAEHVDRPSGSTSSCAISAWKRRFEKPQSDDAADHRGGGEAHRHAGGAHRASDRLVDVRGVRAPPGGCGPRCRSRSPRRCPTPTDCTGSVLMLRPMPRDRHVGQREHASPSRSGAG